MCSFPASHKFFSNQLQSRVVLVIQWAIYWMVSTREIELIESPQHSGSSCSYRSDECLAITGGCSWLANLLACKPPKWVNLLSYLLSYLNKLSKANLLKSLLCILGSRTLSSTEWFSDRKQWNYKIHKSDWIVSNEKRSLGQKRRRFEKCAQFEQLKVHLDAKIFEDFQSSRRGQTDDLKVIKAKLNSIDQMNEMSRLDLKKQTGFIQKHSRIEFRA